MLSKPLFGYGPATFLAAFRLHRPASISRQFGSNFTMNNAHSWPFQYAATLGVMGAVLGWLLRGRREFLLNLTVATVFLVAIDAACYYFLRTVLPITFALYVWFIGALFGQHLKRLASWMSAERASAAPADALAQ